MSTRLDIATKLLFSTCVTASFLYSAYALAQYGLRTYILNTDNGNKALDGWVINRYEELVIEDAEANGELYGVNNVLVNQGLIKKLDQPKFNLLGIRSWPSKASTE